MGRTRFAEAVGISGGRGAGNVRGGGQTAPDSLTPVCAPLPGGGSASSAPPTLLVTLFDRWHEAWLGSPAVADLTGDGSREILAARDEKLLGWSARGGDRVRRDGAGGRIWSSPVVGDLVPGSPGLEVAAASRATLHLWSAAGNPIAPFPGRPGATSCVRSPPARSTATRRSSSSVATTSRLEANGQRDLLMAYEMNGAVVTGFPPNTSGASGCVTDCNITGGFDQNLALGDLDGDGVADIVGAARQRLPFDSRPGRLDVRRRGDLPGRRQGRRHPLPARLRARAAGLAETTHPSTTRRTSPTAPRRSPISTATARTSWSSWARCRTPRRPTACAASASGCSARTARVAPGGRRPSTSRATSAGCGIRAATSSASPTRCRSAISIRRARARDRLRRIRRQDLRRATRPHDRLELHVHDRRQRLHRRRGARRSVRRRPARGDLQHLFDRHRQGEAVRARTERRAAAPDSAPRSRRDAGADGGRRRRRRRRSRSW